MQLTPTQDILPVTAFKKNAKAVMRQVRRTGRPVVLTVHGKADTMLVDARQYEQMKHDYELLKDLVQAEQEIANGRYVKPKDLLKDLKHVLGL